ncbi:hypothetical protein RND81_02G144500 [Saponaria officinalis]|uniref:Retrotransposon gag domain-containing protein n=1 Tax=Saponaria officinalis TaxID=3572 RepID=A0AAW1MUI6_SAPOF
MQVPSQLASSPKEMIRKAVVNAAAASIPTKPRKIFITSITAAANTVIESGTHSRKESRTLKADKMTPHKLKDSPKKNESSSPIFASVMAIGANNIEDQMLEMKRLLEQVMKDNAEKNKKIENLRKEMKNAIKSQLGEGSSSSLHYVKAYTKRIDAMRMPLGYKPPKFQQFDGKGKPNQHIAHFVETCNNAGTDGDVLLKQFVRSLKGIAFDWYNDLGSESVDSWDHMEDQFLNRFYSTLLIVSMSELTKTTQWENEPVVEYIGSRSTFKEATVVNTTSKPVKISPKPKVSNHNRLTLKELQAKKYLFPDSDLSSMLDDLLEKDVIQLPGPKRPDEVNKTNDPNYCRYHRLVSHPLEKCVTLKEKIMQLANKGKIILDLNEVVTSNHTTVIMGKSDTSSSLISQMMGHHHPDELCVHKI